MRQLGLDAGRQPVRVAERQALPHQAFQALLRGLLVALEFVRVLVAELGQAERAARGDLGRAGDRLRVGRIQSRHLLGRLQVTVGEPLAAVARVVDGAALAYAGDDVLQDAALRGVVEDVSGDDGRHPGALGHVRQLAQAQRLARPPAQAKREMAATGERGPHPAQLGFQVVVRHVRQKDEQGALASLRQIQPGQGERALAAATLGQGQKAAEPGVGGPVRREGEHRQAVRQIQPAADHQADADLLRPGVGARDPGQSVVVGDGQRLVAERLGLQHQLLDPAGAAQEGVVRADLQLGVGGHQPAFGWLCPLVLGAARSGFFIKTKPDCSRC